MSTLVVHGATGTQGAPIAGRLVADGHTVLAVARTADPARLPDGVRPVAADLLDTAALASAYEGADAVVAALPLVFDDTAVPQAESVLAALRKAGVPRAVLNVGGPLAPAPIGVPYVDARAILAAQLPDAVERATVVGPVGPYMENLSAPWSAPRIAAGEVAYPLPAEAPVPWVALDDLAAVVAEAVAADAPPAFALVVGPEALTGDRAAAEISAALGREVRWTTVPHTEYEQMLAPHLGAGAAAGIAGFYAPPPPGAPGLPQPDPSQVRPGTTTLREWALRSL